MTALATTYLGLPLAHPIAPSASPLAKDLDGVRALEDAGAPMIVLPSLFEEQIEHESLALHEHLEAGAGSFAEATGSYLPEPPASAFTCEDYLDLVRRARAATGVPIVASLNASRLGAWVDYAELIEQAGAHALELDVYRLATDPEEAGIEVERSLLKIVEAVREATSLPLAVKLHPFFSSVPALARDLENLGADGLVLFNRFYQPDLDLENLEVVPRLDLSRSAESLLPIRWIAILRGRVRVSLAATTGIHSALDAAKAIAAGADVACCCSALLKHGPGRLTEIRRELARWLEEHEYASIDELRASMSQERSPDPGAFERSGYVRTLLSYRP